MTVSMVTRCYETETRPIELDEVWRVIRTGDHDLKPKITQIRNRYEVEKEITGDPKKAKKAVADLKLELPGFLPSGSFSKRETGCLVEYSGILCADCDSLGDRITQIRDILVKMPFVRAIALSPSGDGLKVFINVINDPDRHEDSFRSIKDNFLGLEVEIDEKCKDPTRICFFTYDPELWVRIDGNEILPPADPIPRASRPVNLTSADVGSCQEAAVNLVAGFGSQIEWDSETHGLVKPCPGQHLHTNRSGPRDCEVHLDNAPNFHCFHDSCTSVLGILSSDLARQIGKLEWLKNKGFSTSTIPIGGSGKWKNLSKPNGESAITPEKPLIEVCTIEELENYVAPEGIKLIGDYHITADTGFIFVIGGQASVGKSLALIWLGVAGARGDGDYFGMPVHRKFKVLAIQNENGVFRLSRIIKDLGCKELKDHLFLTKPPPYGMLFRNDDFRKQLVQIIEKCQPDIVVLDPWNSVARDQEQVTYLETFDTIRSVLPPDTVLGILAHTRKPQKEQDRQGRGLMHVLAGSHVLTSVPRTVFVMQHASDDTEEDQIVWTCCKNNDGELGKATAWKRHPSSVFTPVPNFDWATFYGPDKGKTVAINESMIIEVFEDGPLLKVQAIEKLVELSGAHKSACYNALSEKGRFSDLILHKGKLVDCLKRPSYENSST